MKLIARLAVLGISVLGLGGVAVYAAANPNIVKQAQSIITTTVDVIVQPPTPSPTPIVIPNPSPIPTITPPPIPTPIPTPAAPVAFPVVQPTATTIVNQGNPQATVVPVAVPQTAVFIGIASINGGDPAQYSDSNTGGVKCNAPCTIVFTADWQGGFTGVTPTFKWSDGATGQQDSHDYTVAGIYHISTLADEVYNGVTYEVGSANSNITITIQ